MIVPNADDDGFIATFPVALFSIEGLAAWLAECPQVPHFSIMKEGESVTVQFPRGIPIAEALAILNGALSPSKKGRPEG
ncbi:MAG TPA: hypothetical protein VFE47_22165 [Tepidisphaeraceae bacterium]|jgi:hypothetical protein|nr:hypothetical protein [Tepidisphaeraceae bacterium]